MTKKGKIKQFIRIKWIGFLDLAQDLLFFGKNYSYSRKVPNDDSSTNIVSTPYSIIRKAFKRIKMRRGKFIDIGCGSGRVVAWASKKGLFDECYGIEKDEKAFSKAKNNTKRNKKITIIKGDAFDLDFSNFDCFYMWKPMKRDSWIALISKILACPGHKVMILVNDSEIYDWLSKNEICTLVFRSRFETIYGTKISSSKSMYSIWELN